MEVLRDCQSPIEMNSFDVESNSVDVDMNSRIIPEKQAMIPAKADQNSVHNNNNHVQSAGMYRLNSPSDMKLSSLGCSIQMF